MSYADITIRDPNPIKRWMQHRRFTDALAVLKAAELSVRTRVLDFGAGDGELVRQMALIPLIEAFVYEPAPSLMAEARVKLAGLEFVMFTDNLDSVDSEIFDYVFCLEVFEHLPEKESLEALDQIHRLLKPDGIAVIGVPHELFLPAMIKGIFRMSRRYGHFDARPSNIFWAVLGRPPLQRPVAEICAGLPYHPHHLGFDYRALERLLQGRLRVERKWFSPLRILGAALNSEVYFLLRKAKPTFASEASARH